jgi:hypothetical protein
MKKIPKRMMRSAYGGTAMAEFGPGLGILLIAIFFPLVDLLCVCLSYGLCLVLNNFQVHEASLLPQAEAKSAGGSVKKGIPDKWGSGMGHFVKMQGPVTTDVTYRAGLPGSDSGNTNVQDKVVRVTTTVTCSPFLPIPLPVANVPGLNGPMIFTISTERAMENPDNAP